MKLCGLVLALTLLASPLAAQQKPTGIIWGSDVDRPKPSDVLKQYRAEYPTPMDTAAHVGELLNRVAWEYRDLGMKLLGKTGGATCPMPNGTLISCDFLVHAPSVTGFDVFGDAGAGGRTEPSDFVWGPGPEDFTDAIKNHSRTFVDPIEPEAIFLVKKPLVAVDVSPKNQADKVPLTTNEIKWDSDGETFDVYFGKVNPPPLVASGFTENVYHVGLVQGTIYFWRVDSKNARGVTPGPVWSFATVILEGLPPVIAPPDEVPPPVVTPAHKMSVKEVLGFILAGIFGAIFCLNGGCR